MRTLLLVATLASLVSLTRADQPCSLASHCHLPAWGIDGSLPNDNVGHSVAMDGDMAVVGSLQGKAVRVYFRGGTSWQLAQTIQDPEPGATGFGTAVALNEDMLYVGAPQSSLAAANAGAVHVYKRAGSTSWTLYTTLLDPTPEANAAFGRALSAHGGWLAIGAPNDAGTGRVHIWRFDGGSPQSVGVIGGGVPAVTFGHSVALHRPTGSSSAFLFVGDPAFNAAGANAGVVRFIRVSPIAITFGPVLQPAGLSAGDRFGTSIAYDGQHLVAGANGDDSAAENAGAAFVYDALPQLPLTAQFASKLVPCQPLSTMRFGTSVAVRGNRIAVGAPDQPGAIGAALVAGGYQRVHLFRPALFGPTWIPDGVIATSDADANRFGISVALGAEQIVVGAPWSNFVGQQSGAAYLVSTASPLAGGACPTQYLATAISYGVGKPGPGGTPTLTLTSLPTPGTQTFVRVGNVPAGSVPFLLVGTLPAWFPFDGGILHVADPFVAQLPVIGITGATAIPWNVSADPAVLGVGLYLQSMALTPVGATVHTAALAVAVGH